MKSTSANHIEPCMGAGPDPGAGARKLFPIFDGDDSRRLAYLDTAASSQKPKVVIDRISSYLCREHANIHRGVYQLSAQATRNYEIARSEVAGFVGASDPRCLVFTKGATESINLVSHSFEKYFSSGDTILLSIVEHHSNIVPWQLLAARRGVRLEFVDVSQNAALDMEDFRRKLKACRPKLIAITHVSNAFGSVMPIREICSAAKDAGAKVLVDAAQSAAHAVLDVEGWGADFLAFSGHKVYGPTGIGALYISPALLDYLEPFQGGGDMIASVSTAASTWAEPPAKFEAGTPAIAEALGLGSAVGFINSIGKKRISRYEHQLFAEAFDALSREEGVILYGPALEGGEQESIISFNLKGVHAHDVATVADDFNVQIRAGHHCAMPAMQRLGLGSTVRISFGIYSTQDDIQQLLEALRYARKVLG